MCRLLGFKGNKKSKLTPFLLTAPNSLYKQALKDARNVTNSEGWGIGFFQDGEPFVNKRALSARADITFTHLTNYIITKTLIAHVRQATVGDINDANAHPFHFSKWIFAHNGTIENFKTLQPKLHDKLKPIFKNSICGTTDSEVCFYLFLTYLSQLTDIHKIEIPLHHVVEALNMTICTIYDLSEDILQDNPHAMNFLITNGEIMAATRVNNTLFYAEMNRKLDDEIILQRDHLMNGDISLELNVIDANGNGAHSNILIASEPITNHDQWFEIPNNSIIVVNNNLEIVISHLRCQKQ